MMKLHRMVMLSLIVAIPALAQDDVRRSRPWQFYWENDAGAAFSGSDEYYTNGNRISVGYMGFSRRAFDFREKFCARFCKEVNRPLEQLSFAFGHQFYTPERIDISAPQPLDRPWAGWMYGAVNLQISDFDTVQHIFEAQVGVLGQGAGARFVQTEFHRLIGDELPQGWQNQLRNEPTLNLLYTQNRRYIRHRNLDVVISPAAILGTVQTYPALGGTVRLGHNITGFPAGPLAPSAFGSGERPRFEAYVFAGADGRFVLHNAFLDGGFFRSGPSVDRRNFVSDLRAGASVRWNNFRFTYTFIRRGEEFTPRPGRTKSGRHDFGSVVLAWEPGRPD